MPRVLITGGTGVLGRAVAPRLAQAGSTGRGLSRPAGAAGGGRPMEESGCPSPIQRAPQFHPLVDQTLRNLTRFPIGFYPAGFKSQPIDPGEVAERIVQQVGAGPGGRLRALA